MELGKVTAEKITLIQNKQNNRPSKLLGYKTPNDIYDTMCLAA
ncbi:MAG: IS30 family transposase [Candidatus Azotimanducaceae bacterium]|jgi:IS30 family transposase